MGDSLICLTVPTLEQRELGLPFLAIGATMKKAAQFRADTLPIRDRHLRNLAGHWFAAISVFQSVQETPETIK
jgi:hypothetical protein